MSGKALDSLVDVVSQDLSEVGASEKPEVLRAGHKCTERHGFSWNAGKCRERTIASAFEKASEHGSSRISIGRRMNIEHRCHSVAAACRSRGR